MAYARFARWIRALPIAWRIPLVVALNIFVALAVGGLGALRRSLVAPALLLQARAGGRGGFPLSLSRRGRLLRAAERLSYLTTGQKPVKTLIKETG